MSDPVRNYDHKTIQFRRGTTAEWKKFGSTCIPAEAEICVEFFQTATGSRNGSVGIKVGNGVSTYNQLPHIVSDEESDPVFTNHPAYQITQDLIDSWNDDAEGIPDAPNSKAYSRQKGVWVEAPTLNQVKDLEAKVDAIDPDGSGEDYDDTQIKADLAAETQARIDGDAAIQAEVDDLENYDDTQIKADLATETQARIDGDTALDLRIDAVEDSITDDGGFVDAPNDGKLYGRQSEGWSEVPEGGVSDWADIENKPAEFPPEAHDHTIANVTGLSDALDDKSDVGHKHVIADVTGLQDALDNAGGDSATYTLPVVLRSGNAQLPLTLDGAKLAVMTRGGELELPLAA